jgi:ferrochelatase
MSKPKIGVLVMAYGTPGSREEVEPYYTLIRHGRPPTEEQLADLVRRYDAIGGISPLAERTAAQVAGIATALATVAPERFDVRFGSKYTDPSIEDTVASFLEDGITTIVGMALTPHSATLGSIEYLNRARAALGDNGTLIGIEQWYPTPGFAALLAERVESAIAELPAGHENPLVLFTAHSLPKRILELGDTYPDQLQDSADQIANAAGLKHYEIAWQSAGRTPDPWIGPDILDVVGGLPERGISAVVVCPVGFVADHLEVLYDVDIEAMNVANQIGVALTRTRSLNADPAFTAILAEAVVTAAADA